MAELSKQSLYFLQNLINNVTLKAGAEDFEAVVNQIIITKKELSKEIEYYRMIEQTNEDD